MKTSAFQIDDIEPVAPPQAVTAEERLFYPCSTGYVFAATHLTARLQLPFYGMMLLSLDGKPIRVSVAGQAFEQAAMALWAKDVQFHVEHARFVVVAVNPLHSAFRSFSSLPAPHVMPLEHSRYARFYDLMCRASSDHFTHTEALALFKGVLATTRDSLPATPRLDARAQSLMKFLCAKPRSSVADLAQHFGLSYHRTSHLFADAVGLPLRTYQLWQKLYRAGASLLAGASLTEVAHAAGFVDSAHYSKAFQTAYGRCPTEMFKTRRIVVFFRNAFSEASIDESIAASGGD